MSQTFRTMALLLVLAATGAWLATGANRGWTKTSVPVGTVDEITGLGQTAGRGLRCGRGIRLHDGSRLIHCSVASRNRMDSVDNSPCTGPFKKRSNGSVSVHPTAQGRGVARSVDWRIS